MIKQYRKKPVVIEAVQWTGNRDEIMEFVGERALGWNPVGYIVLIATPDGRKAVNYKVITSLPAPMIRVASRSSANGFSDARRHPIFFGVPADGPLPSIPIIASQIEMTLLFLQI